MFILFAMWTKRISFWQIGIVLLLSVLFPRLVAYAVLNQAHLAQLQGEGTIMLYEKAMKLAADDVHIRWQTVRASLDANNYVVAAEAIAPINRYALTSSLFFADVLRTLEAIGQSDQVIDLYNTNRELKHSVLVSDTVALAYINQGEFEKAFVLRPTDLYLTNALWQRTQATHDRTKADIIRENLVYFPLSAIDPANKRLLKYTGKAILNLLESKVWTREQAIHIVTYLVWKYYSSPEIEETLQEFHAHYPGDPAWQALSAELLQYRVNTPTIYSLPTSNTTQYSRNVVKSTALNTFNSIAVMRNDIFWHWGVWQGKESTSALFITGVDPLESNSTIRIMNLWQRSGGGSEVPSYAEYNSKEITFEANSEYTLTLRYKTDQVGKATAFVGLLEYISSPRFIFTHTALPDTAGSWQFWQISGKSYSEPIKVQLLLRMLGTGSVWFDNVQLVKGDLK